LKIDKLEAGGKVFNEDGTTPAVAGTYTMEDGTVVIVDSTGLITTVTLPAALETPPTEEAMQAMFAKFAAGTPEDRIGNLETMCKALMTYNFQWKINEKTREVIEEQAIAAFNALGTPAAFKAQMSAQEKTVAEMKTAHAADLQKVGAAMNGVFDLMLKFAEQPAADAIHTPTDKEVKAQNKRERLATLATNLKELKESQEK